MIIAIAGLAVGGLIVMAALVELAGGGPLLPKRRRAGRRAAVWSTLCTGLVVCIIDLTIATGWNANDPATTLVVAAPAVFILLGLSIFLAGKSRRQRRADLSADHRPVPGTNHGR